MMSQALEYLKNRITLDAIPFTERGSRIMVLRRDRAFHVQLAESWAEDHPTTLVTLELLDEQRAPLEVSTTSYPHRVDITSAGGSFVLGFADTETLMFKLPAGRCGIRLVVQGDAPQQDRRGGVCDLSSDLPLTAAYSTNAVIASHDIEQADGTCSVVLMLDCGAAGGVFTLNLTRTRAVNRYIPDFEAVVTAAQARWQAWLDAVPAVPEVYRGQYIFAWWVLGVNLVRVYTHPQREGLIPSKRGYIGVWNWDSYFHAIALRHVDRDIARNQFRILLDHQLPNGMIPDVIQDHRIISHTDHYGIDADITKPPLTAWAAWKLYEVDGDKAFLDEIYDALVRSQKWWFAEHDSDHNGLCEYAHPYSSGLDNNPLFDDKRVPLETPDLNAYLVLQYDHLAKIAQVLGRGDEAQVWTDAAEALARRLVDMRWDADAGYFWAHHNNQPVRIRTPFNLFPLITGRLPHAIAQRLVQHLTDPAQFWTRYPVPTVAQDDAKHDPNVMWRGPVWINVNYLLIDGLKRAGFAQVASELRRKTLDLMLSQPDICEYYNPNTGEKPPRAVSAFGWSAALFIDLVLDERLAE
ncbi:MAG: glycogen debranching protein [Anaerolineae bacterium]|nr:glycogen debranching protein [Anaerolineae bacterium]